VAIMRVRVRLGAGLSRFAAAPLLSLELDDGATIAQLLERLTAREPALEPALPSVLPVVHGTHAARDDVLHDGDEVALLIPVAGGTEMATIETRTARQTVFVDTFTDGLLGPDVPMLGPVADGGHIVVNTTPG
jgi:molybdopterin converting factor small subunit